MGLALKKDGEGARGGVDDCHDSMGVPEKHSVDDVWDTRNEWVIS